MRRATSSGTCLMPKRSRIAVFGGSRRLFWAFRETRSRAIHPGMWGDSSWVLVI